MLVTYTTNEKKKLQKNMSKLKNSPLDSLEILWSLSAWEKKSTHWEFLNIVKLKRSLIFRDVSTIYSMKKAFVYKTVYQKRQYVK